MESLIYYQKFGWPLTIVFLVGCTLWVVAYGVAIRNIIKYKRVEIPVVGAASNFAWEFIWSFPFGYMVSDFFGPVVLWGYRIWFLMDVFIFASLLVYGHKEMTIPYFKKHFRPIAILLFFAWLVGFYCYAAQGLDTPIGTLTAYFDNISVSVGYVIAILAMRNIGAMSNLVGWCKGWGTGLVSVAVCAYWSTNYFLWVMCAVTFALDMWYIWLYHQRKTGAIGSPLEA